MSMLEAALDYWERGWSIIPIKPETKRPAIKWLEYQDRQPTQDEIYAWWEQWPDHEIAIVTGELTGLVVVDCDNEDALHAAYDAGMRSPIRVKTKRGVHLYFGHPKDGIRRGPRAGSNSRGEDWPKINGLDFRGDGSYALLPPSKGYRWDYPEHTLEWDDAPVWQDWRPSIPPMASDEFHFETLDLGAIREFTAEDFMSEWDATTKYIADHFEPGAKLPTGGGNGRNNRLMRYISECVMDGYFGEELRLRGFAFMREFFADNLGDREFEATCRSIEEAEKRNHPERFDAEGRYIPRPESAMCSTTAPVAAKPAPARKLIQMKDADELARLAQSKSYLIEPWLAPQTIVQIAGYSGSGKSMFLQHALGALACGRKYFGPFEIGRTARVLYLDFEMSMGTVATRLQEIRSAQGDTHDRLNVWTPFIEGRDMNLKTNEGLMELQGWIEMCKPDVVVIDTVRSAWPGLEENSADAWAPINQMALRIRNAGMAVILVHHKNKPGESGVQREAGSTNQLTVLETQVYVSQVFEDETTAKQKAAVWDGSYTMPVWPQLREKLPKGYRLYMVNEISYGKVREWSDVHDQLQWIGYAAHDENDSRIVVSSRSSKQRAKDLALNGWAPEGVAAMLGRPLRIVRDWLEIGA